jgi:hypothetical protein
VFPILSRVINQKKKNKPDDLSGANLVKTMNKRYQIILTLILISVLLHYSVLAQTIDLGMKSGVSMSYRDIMKDNKFVPMPSGSYRLFSYTEGIMLNLKLSERWSFHSEILFVDKGVRDINHQDSLMDKQGKFYYADWTEYEWNHYYYLHFPQTVRYEIPLNKNDKWSVYFELGGYFACYLQSKEVWKTTWLYGNDSGVKYYNEIHDVENTNNAASGPQITIHSFDWGGTAGLGVLINFRQGKLDLNTRYDHDIQPHISCSVPVKTRVYLEMFSMTVGYSLPVLNRKMKNY